jgi:predicted unusual protein kinase regulating ubiquinone biosynthesis (AarF/ABC1/UbiB family)
MAKVRQEPRFDRIRYLRVVGFFASAFLAFIWWDLALRRVPGLRGAVQRTATPRWRRTARRFRALAVQMGGVLIKLGQFLSTRVDILPAEITSELAGLQDEVPAESLADIRAVVEAEFGRPVDATFAWFSAQPAAAASLAQVHQASLAGGEEVVVKIQRPRIETLVETDLAAIRVAANWLKLYRPVARRVDLDRLFAEFAATTRAELDFVAEGKNAERFAADFADNPGIRIARVYWDHTTRRVLTLENVAAIKITDFTALEAAGVSRPQVARRLYETYLEQIFVNNFVHADPHPGNLFVRPLPQAPPADDGTLSREPVGSASLSEGTPFELIFVDFGMVAVIAERLRASLREYIIGLGTRDPHRVVQAYTAAGVLLPGADRKRLEELHGDLFERFGKIKMGQLRDVAFEQATFIAREYRDLIYEMPFQFPTEVLFVMRAVAILSGIATSLDPEFDPWAATIPFAERLAAGEVSGRWREWLGELAALFRLAVGLPGRLDRLAAQAERGELAVQASLAADAARALRRVERAVDRLAWAVIAAGLLVSGAILRVLEGARPEPAAWASWLSTGLLIAAGLALLWGLTRR